ncbi:hypothetical protein D3C86_1635920 [compost metagenome]
MVEMGQFVVLAAHAPTAVEQHKDLLVAFFLVFTGNRHAVPGRGFPVDLTQAVAFAKLAQLMKLQALATAWLLAHAQLHEPVVHGQ